jgi:CelD/BcsL family acetyltransferase involved in cellulose biosynthesis
VSVKVETEAAPDREEILRFAESLPRATFFHTPAWSESIAAAYPRSTPGWITAREGGRLVGFMPFVRRRGRLLHSLSALPFGTYGDPLARDGAVATALLSAFVDLAGARRCRRGEACLFHGADTEALRGRVELRTEECRLIDLEGGFERFWRTCLNKERRRVCNKGAAEGIEVRPLGGPDEVQRLYELYRRQSAAWGGGHPYPEKLLSELFGRRDEGVIVWGAFREGALLGAHVDFYFGEMAQAWQAAMSRQSRSTGAPVMLVVRAVREACDRGMSRFNLGSSGGNPGLVRFKESLGATEHRYPVLLKRGQVLHFNIAAGSRC